MNSSGDFASFIHCIVIASKQKDGLEIFNDIPYYAENGFESIPKEEWDAFKWAGLYLQRPKEA
ncbi:hypothetical protein, partial [Bacillus cereus]